MSEILHVPSFDIICIFCFKSKFVYIIIFSFILKHIGRLSSIT